MKMYLLSLFVLVNTAAHAGVLSLDPTPARASVQATLKNILVELLEEGSNDNVSGDFDKVTLTGDSEYLTCRETKAHFPNPFTNLFSCNLYTLENTLNENLKYVELPAVTDSNSFQAILTKALYAKFEEEGAWKVPGGSFYKNSSGSIVLEDKHSMVSCQEQSDGLQDVQMYSCSFRSK